MFAHSQSSHVRDKGPVSLYPNPASAYITLSVHAGIAAQKPMAVLFDASGRMLRSFSISSTSIIDIAALPSGSYFIHFLYNDTPQTLSFIKK